MSMLENLLEKGGEKFGIGDWKLVIGKKGGITVQKPFISSYWT